MSSELISIVAEGCNLVGYTVARLSVQSVNLGYDTFRVKDCEFHIEISNYQAKSPPVIVPYFDTKQRDIIERLMTRTLHEEIVPILQACMFSYVNTSLIFGSSLQKYLKPQTNIFEETFKYMKHIVREANKETISKNQVAIELPPIVISWNYTSFPEAVWNFIKISNSTIYGIDSLYSAQSGGPYKLQSIKIAETLRFNTLMVRGNFYYENNTAKGDHDYVVEIKDVHINFEQDLDTKSAVTLEVMNWRTLETSIIELDKNIHERKAANAVICGYLMNILPEVLKNHLLKIFGQNDLDKISNNNENIKSESEDNNIKVDGNVPASSGTEDEAIKHSNTEPNKDVNNENKLQKAALLLAMASETSHKQNKLDESEKSQDSKEEDKSETDDENTDNRSEVKNDDSNERLHGQSSNGQDGSFFLSERSDELSRRKAPNLKANYERNIGKDTMNEIRK